jgi:Arc/MetJ-type ribon-helix-helix transcriptional regulator
MNLSLPAEIQRAIDERVKSGRYHCAEDVVAAAVISLGQRELVSQLNAAELEAIYPGIKAKLIEGLTASAAGKLSDGEAFFEELEREDPEIPAPGHRTA